MRNLCHQLRAEGGLSTPAWRAQVSSGGWSAGIGAPAEWAGMVLQGSRRFHGVCAGKAKVCARGLSQ